MTRIAKALGVARSNLHERLSKNNADCRPLVRNRKSRQDDETLLPIIRKITDVRPTYGYRRVTAIICRELQQLGKARINAKRVYRIMRENKLLLQPYTGKSTKTHDGKIVTLKSNIRWCSDGFRIQCWNGDKLEVAFSLDCHDREAIAWIASTRGLDGEMVRDWSFALSLTLAFC